MFESIQQFSIFEKFWGTKSPKYTILSTGWPVETKKKLYETKKKLFETKKKLYETKKKLFETKKKLFETKKKLFETKNNINTFLKSFYYSN